MHEVEFWECPFYLPLLRQTTQRQNCHNSCNFEIRRQTEMVSTKPIQYTVGEWTVLSYLLLGYMRRDSPVRKANITRVF